MKERPILFSAPMVRAILDGRKTQTRRIVKLNEAARVRHGTRNWHLDDPEVVLACPYGTAGERLWVRETCGWHWANDDLKPTAITPEDWSIFYPADDHMAPAKRDGSLATRDQIKRLRPSIHMPRWASRITLEISGVRVERLREISEADAQAEGAEKMHLDDIGQTWKSYRRGFQSLWESINGPESWAANPWVWVIEFRRLTENVGVT